MEASVLDLMIALDLKKGLGLKWSKGSARGAPKMEAIALELGMLEPDRKKGHVRKWTKGLARGEGGKKATALDRGAIALGQKKEPAKEDGFLPALG